MFCSNSDPDWAVPSCATVCGSFVDYEQQIRNNPIPVINQALTANSTNLASAWVADEDQSRDEQPDEQGVEMKQNLPPQRPPPSPNPPADFVILPHNREN
jgi:hypothetical protein